MSIRQIDWRSDISAIRPYLEQACGVVHIEFQDGECAPNQFSSLLKQIFAEYDVNRFSIRVDLDFATTHVVYDILNEFETQLRRFDYKVDAPDLSKSINMFAGIESGENTSINVGSISVGNGPHHAMLNQRTETIRNALDEFVANGGRFMIEHRDSSMSRQAMFLKHIWAPILSKFVDNSLVYIQMLGPECRQTPHEDAPDPQLKRTLPIGFETDEVRKSDACEDLIDIFEAEGHNRDAAAAAAATHLQNNQVSVSKMHNNLAGVLLSMKQRQAG